MTEKLFYWAVAGKTSFNESKEEIVDALLLLNPNTRQYRIVSVEEYKKEALKNIGTSKTKGYPFSWTHASGSKGKRIQLKIPIIYKDTSS